MTSLKRQKKCHVFDNKEQIIFKKSASTGHFWKHLLAMTQEFCSQDISL